MAGLILPSHGIEAIIIHAEPKQSGGIRPVNGSVAVKGVNYSGDCGPCVATCIRGKLLHVGKTRQLEHAGRGIGIVHQPVAVVHVVDLRRRPLGDGIVVAQPHIEIDLCAH